MTMANLVKTNIIQPLDSYIATDDSFDYEDYAEERQKPIPLLMAKYMVHDTNAARL